MGQAAALWRVLELIHAPLLCALCPGHSCELAEDGLPLRAIGWGGICHGTLCRPPRTLGYLQVVHLRRSVMCRFGVASHGGLGVTPESADLILFGTTVGERDERATLFVGFEAEVGAVKLLEP